jgi:hypothetical protein
MEIALSSEIEHNEEGVQITVRVREVESFPYRSVLGPSARFKASISFRSCPYPDSCGNRACFRPVFSLQLLLNACKHCSMGRIITLPLAGQTWKPGQSTLEELETEVINL